MESAFCCVEARISPGAFQREILMSAIACFTWSSDGWSISDGLGAEAAGGVAAAGVWAKVAMVNRRAHPAQRRCVLYFRQPCRGNITTPDAKAQSMVVKYC